MLDYSTPMDAEHLVALKHSKRAPILQEPSISMPTTRIKKTREEEWEEDDSGLFAHNRGHKLKRKSVNMKNASRFNPNEFNTNNDFQDENDDESGYRRSAVANISGSSGSRYSNSNRDIVLMRSMGIEMTGEAGEELSDDENPYAGIKVNELLSPLETSTEILQRPQLRKIFQSPQLQIMAVHAMAMIEREKEVNKMMSRLAMILQGDDPMYPQLGYGMGEGCSTAQMGKPDQEEYINGNKEWKKNGEDREQVQETLSLLMENINCSNQYIDLLNESRDAVNHVSKEKRRLWKKLKEKRERIRRRMHSK